MLKPIFNDVIPVLIASRIWRSSSSFLESWRIARHSSNSKDTPDAKTPSLPKLLGSSTKALLSLSESSFKGFICSPRRRRVAFPLFKQHARNGASKANERPKRHASRGIIFCIAAREDNRSKSPNSRSSSLNAPSCSPCSTKCRTASCLSAIRPISRKGRANHRRSKRLPIGVSVASIVSTSVRPLLDTGSNTSSLRRVNRSSHTYWSLSIREIPTTCDRFSCFVKFKYASTAPAAQILACISSIPNPRSPCVPKCSCKRRVASISVKAQSSKRVVYCVVSNVSLNHSVCPREIKTSLGRKLVKSLST